MVTLFKIMSTERTVRVIYTQSHTHTGARHKTEKMCVRERETTHEVGTSV